MTKYDSFISWSFLILLSAVQFVPAFGAIDKWGPHFFYLSIVGLLSTGYLLFFSTTVKKVQIPKNFIVFSFLGLVLLSLLSVIWAFNPTEALISFFKYAIILVCLLNLLLHFTKLGLGFEQLAKVFVFLVATDALVILISFLSIYDFNAPPGRTNALMGLSSNLNITGFSLLFRLPFVVYFIFKGKNTALRFLSAVLFALVLFFIFTSGSRGATLASFLLIGLLTVSFWVFNIHSKLKNSLILVGLSALTLGVNTFLYQNSTNKVTDRVGTLLQINEQKDSSTNERLTWYGAAWEGIQEKPLQGFGIGNWKIVGNKYVSEYIEQYTVPVHVHNDFLEFFVELGLLGFLIFVLFLLSIGYSIVLSASSSFSDNGLNTLLLLFAWASFLIDASLNFPMARPIALTNLILIAAYAATKNVNGLLSNQKSRLSLVVALFVGIGAFISSFKVYGGLVDEIVFYDRIGHARGFDTPLKVLDQLNDSYPNINHTTIPITTIKGIYYWKNGRNEEAKKMLKEGNTINPYLFVSESNLATIYLEEGKIDSAYAMAKKAFYGLPKNERHTNIYQMILGKKKDLKELNAVFDKTRYRKKELIYSNHLQIISFLKLNGSFSQRDKEIAAEAVRLFPDNKDIRKSYTIIANGPKLVGEANALDAEAKTLFTQKKYDLAIEKWQLAKAILPTESSYYLNMAQTLSLMGQVAASNAVLDSIKLLRIHKGDGQWEFLRAINDLSRNQKGMACQNLLIAYRLGKVNETLPLIRQLKCPTR